VRDLRFGVSDGDRFSRYWKIRAAAGRPELVVMSDRLGGSFHLTMHEEPAQWHAKVTLPTRLIQQPWVPSTEFRPGLRRLVRVLIPAEAVRYPAPRASQRVTWFPAPDAETWIEFTVLHCAQGRPRILNADVVGAAQLADGTEALVIHRQARRSPPRPRSPRRTLRRPSGS
jgi:hypothetical protein